MVFLISSYVITSRRLLRQPAVCHLIRYKTSRKNLKKEKCLTFPRVALSVTIFVFTSTIFFFSSNVCRNSICLSAPPRCPSFIDNNRPSVICESRSSYEQVITPPPFYTCYDYRTLFVVALQTMAKKCGQIANERKKHGREVWGAYRKCRLPNTFGWNAAVYTASASRHEFSVRSDSLGHVISRRHGTFQKRDATWLFLFFFFWSTTSRKLGTEIAGVCREGERE